MQAAPGERRQLTVMFSDLADSTALSGRLDPEDLRTVIHGYHEACAMAVERHGGYVGKWLGDGMLAYFSYPVAHEDDAQRAIRAGLEITAWAALQAPQGGLPVRVRVGLHTGLCVIGEMGSGERVEHTDVVGETPNIAARVQTAVPANAVAVSAATWRLAQGYFVAESMGRHTLKGVAQPLELHIIIAETGVQSRLDVGGTLTPLVGRDDEMAVLTDRWASAASGDGQVVLVSGEAGIGKSRLVRALRDLASGETLRIELHCSQSHQNSALHPVISHFQRALSQGANAGDDGAAAVRLAAMLAEAEIDTQVAVPLLVTLLGLPIPDGYAALDLAPEEQRLLTYRAILSWLAADARKRPVLLAVEDLHWIDPSTLELLGMMVREKPAGRMFVLLTYRPEFEPPWQAQPFLSSVTVPRLSPEDVDECIRRVAGGRQMPPEVVAQIVTRTDGVPLFVEELTKMVLESGLLRADATGLVIDGPLPPTAIPETLQDSLMARLDRLADVKEVAQLGSTLGREFSGALISAVSPLPEGELARALDILVESGLVVRRRGSGDQDYVFKHALVQDAAYNSLLRSTRQRFHQRIGQVLVGHFPDIAGSQPEVVAHHYTEAGLVSEAVGWWRAAGSLARTRGANVEAVAHLNRGLEIIGGLPEGPERNRIELALAAALIAPLSNIHGFSSPVVSEISSRALALADGEDDPPELAPALYGAWTFHLVGGGAETLYWAERTLAAAKRLGHPAHVSMGHFAASVAHWNDGALTLANEHALAGRDLFDRANVRANALEFSFDPGLGNLGLSSIVLSHSGRHAEGERVVQQAVDEGRSAAQPDTLAFMLTIAAWLAVWRRDAAQAVAHGAAAVAVSEAGGGRSWWPWALSSRGWGKVATGDVPGGLIDIQTATSMFDFIGAGFRFHAILAEAYLLAGDPVRAEALALRGIEAGSRRMEGALLADCHRIHGLCLLAGAKPAPEKAELEFLKAIEIAHGQGTLSFELRSARDLARLWNSQGRQTEALAALEPVYAGFSESFDAPDLLDARELLIGLRAFVGS